jgi:hypothetical protein
MQKTHQKHHPRQEQIIFFTTKMMMIPFILCLLLLFVIVIANKDNPHGSKPWCTPQNLHLVNASDGEFLLLPDGSFKYEFAHCKLRRFNVDTASKCLKGVHLVFMGDSLSRYFYLSLAHLFARKKWASKFARLPAHPTAPRSILSEKDFQNWSLFYHESNTLLSSGKNAFEICDCYRNDSRFWFPPEGDKDPSNHQQVNCMENRHFRYMPSANYDDQSTDVRLSYIQWYGHMPIRGHKEISIYPRDHTFPTFIKNLNDNLCTANADAEPPTAVFKVAGAAKNGSETTEKLSEVATKHDKKFLTFNPLAQACAWTRNDQDQSNYPSFCYGSDCPNFPQELHDNCQKFERQVLAPLGTTHLLFNIGWHGGLQHFQPHLLGKVMDAAEKYFSYPGPASPNTSPKPGKGYWGDIYLPKVSWRSATYDAVFRSGDDIAKEHSTKVGQDKFNFFEVYKMTKKLREIHTLIENKDTEGLKRMLKVSHQHWPKDREVNFTTVQTTYVDNCHLEPWAYTEIHAVFLNSICPLEDS